MQFLLPVLLLATVQVALSGVPAQQVARSKAIALSDILRQDQTPLDPRIAGGLAATAGQFPWTTSIYFANTYLCTGALISTEWVLTSASCVSNAAMQVFSLRFGSLKYDTYTLERSSIRKIVHASYNSATLVHDIALLQILAVPGNNANYAPINLDRSTRSFADSKARYAGWGATTNTGTTLATDLRYVEASVLTNANCQSAFSDAIDSTHICTSGADNKGLCYGDSGNALALQKDGKWYHIGVASFLAQGACANGPPSGFTRTSSHIDWIATTAGLTIPNSAGSLTVNISVLLVALLSVVKQFTN